jgi:Fur family ferric uptake transcriptional regulator
MTFIRDTKQRRAIREVFERSRRPLAPEEALSLAKVNVKGLGIATIYRAIRDFVEAGFLTSVNLPGKPPRYEVSHKHHHHHFHCKKCDSLYEIDNCPGELQNLTPKGFVLETHEITLFGLCKGCVKR